MPSKSELALAWQVRQARSKGFRSLVRKEVPAPADDFADEPVDATTAAPEPSEPGPELTASESADGAPAAPESKLASIIKRIRFEALK